MARAARIHALGKAEDEVSRSGAARHRRRKASPALRAKKNRPSSRKGAKISAPRMPAAALVKKPIAIPADTLPSGASKHSTAPRGDGLAPGEGGRARGKRL